MTVKKSHRIQLVVNLEKRREDSAADKCEKIKQKLEQETNKLRSLDEYCNEYESSFRVTQVTVRPEDLIKQRGFLQQLNEAKKAQETVVSQIQQTYDEHKQTWLKCYIKRQNMEDLVKRYQKQEEMTADKKEQKLIDDWVTQTRR